MTGADDQYRCTLDEMYDRDGNRVVSQYMHTTLGPAQQKATQGEICVGLEEEGEQVNCCNAQSERLVRSRPTGSRGRVTYYAVSDRGMEEDPRQAGRKRREEMEKFEVEDVAWRTSGACLCTASTGAGEVPRMSGLLRGIKRFWEEEGAPMASYLAALALFFLLSVVFWYGALFAFEWVTGIRLL